MKKLLLLIGVMIWLSSCKKDVQVRDVLSDAGTKIELSADPELVNTIKDAEAIAFRKNNPHGNPHNGGGGDTTTPQPPNAMHKGCFLIDGDGYNVPAGVWSVTGFYCAGSDFDQSQINAIINQVKSYWAAFDAEITTDEALYNTYPVNKRMRVVITRTNFYGNVGGVANINSINWIDQQKQCFVFCDLLGRNLDFNAKATAHEMGHTTNCFHHRNISHYPDGSCAVIGEYQQSNHLMANCYYFNNCLFTTGETTCGVFTNDPNNIKNSLNQ